MSYNIKNNLNTNIDLTGMENMGDTIRQLNFDSVKALVETDLEYTTTKVEPETIKVGDFIDFHGCIGKVEKIQVTNHDGKGDVYGMSTSYVTGRLDMFRWFLGSICNGCFRGNLAYTQGNNLASWHKAEAVNI
jgi:hypothetical protein